MFFIIVITVIICISYFAINVIKDYNTKRDTVIHILNKIDNYDNYFDYNNYIDNICRNLNNYRTSDNSKFLNDLYRKYNMLNKSVLLDHMLELLNNPTPYENIIYDYLDNNEIFFIKQCPCLGYILDCYIPKYNLNIEIDGEFHKNQKDADRERSKKIFNTYKIKTYRISNKQVKYGYYKQMIDDIFNKYETV